MKENPDSLRIFWACAAAMCTPLEISQNSPWVFQGSRIFLRLYHRLILLLTHKVNQSGKVFPLLHTKENRNVQHENTYGLYCSFIFLTAEVRICPSAQQEHNYVISTHVCSIVQWCLQEQAVHEYLKKAKQYKPRIILTACWCEYCGQPWNNTLQEGEKRTYWKHVHTFKT